jgi:hypothetical protein
VQKTSYYPSNYDLKDLEPVEGWFVPPEERLLREIQIVDERLRHLKKVEKIARQKINI